MGKNFSEQRLAENEVLFRQTNEQVTKQLTALQAAAITDSHPTLVQTIDTPLHFCCECSNEDCRQRIKLKPSTYIKLHQNPKRFVIVPGHEVKRIEFVILSRPTYSVIEKRLKPPKSADKLHDTH